MTFVIPSFSETHLHEASRPRSQCSNPYPGVPFPGGGGSILAVWVPETQRERALAAIAAGVEAEEGAEEP
jgi:hypothetical protein